MMPHSKQNSWMSEQKKNNTPCDPAFRTESPKSSDPDPKTKVYKSKGDRYTLGLTPMPGCIIQGQRADGSSYKRRVRTNEVTGVLNISQVVKALRKSYLPDTFAEIPLYLDIEPLSLSDYPPGIRLYLSSTEQSFGKRWWFLCPLCQKRKGKLYVIKTPQSSGLGCRVCLGLSYPTQARHKCPEQDGREMDAGKLKGRHYEQVNERLNRRYYRARRGMLRLIARVEKRR